MPVQLKTKEKAATVPQSVETEDHVVKLVDRYAELTAKIEKVAPLAKEAAAIKDELLEIASKYPAASPVTFSGTAHKLEFSEVEFRRTVTDPAAALKLLKKAVGAEKVWNLVKITLGVLDDYLTPDEREAVTKSDRTGPRKANLVKKA